MKRILLVDDDVSVLHLLARALPEYDLAFARDGREAWMAAAQLGKPDLLITDYMMPSIFGDELIGQLRAPWPDLKVLVISGHSGVLDHEAPSWWTGEPHLPKPFDVRALRETVALLTADGQAAALDAASA
jgi:CheY-like chemotaxis protein